MRRWVINRHGRDVLRVDETDTPLPGPGEVRVQVGAVALNARDLMMIDHGMGLAIQFPFVPASDMTGVVEATGDGVERFRPGDRVIANFLPEWIDGRPGGSARTPRTGRWAVIIRACWRNTCACRRNGWSPHRARSTMPKPRRCRWQA